jgi:hypothetical protein
MIKYTHCPLCQNYLVNGTCSRIINTSEAGELYHFIQLESAISIRTEKYIIRLDYIYNETSVLKYFGEPILLLNSTLPLEGIEERIKLLLLFS